MLPRSRGFFVTLFTQLLALLSAIGITIHPTLPNQPRAEVFNNNPPAIVSQIADPNISASEPLVVRIIQTQLDNLGGIGQGLAGTADLITNTILALPQTLADALDRNGAAGLPGGAADVLGGLVNVVQQGTNGWINLLSAILLKELNLIGGAQPTPYLAAAASIQPQLQQLPFPERFIRVQVDGLQGIGQALGSAVSGIGDALSSASGIIGAALSRGGPSALPAGLAAATGRILQATQQGITGIVSSVADLARGELSLIPGAEVNTPRVAAAEVQPPPTGGSNVIELVVRFPLAVAVAGSDLIVTGFTAVTLVTGGFVQAASDILRSITNAPLPGGTTKAAAEERPLTLPQALAKAPATISNGFVQAGGAVQAGVTRARTDFTNTLQGRTNERALTGDNVAIAGKVDDPTIVAGDNGPATKPDAVRTNRPRPIAGVVKAIAGTIRAALGLPDRKATADAAQ
jgi:hypothetical protein